MGGGCISPDHCRSFDADAAILSRRIYLFILSDFSGNGNVSNL